MDPLQLLEKALGADEAAVLWPHLSVARFSPGQSMFRDGVPSSHLYFVTEGTLNASVGTNSGPVGLGVVGPGSWVGEVGFVDGGPATANVIAGEPVVALRVTHDELMLLKDEHPHAAAVLMRAVTVQLADRLRASTAGIVEQVAEGRYRLRAPEENRGWMSNALGWLLGARGTP